MQGWQRTRPRSGGDLSACPALPLTGHGIPKFRLQNGPNSGTCLLELGGRLGGIRDGWDSGKDLHKEVGSRDFSPGVPEVCVCF